MIYNLAFHKNVTTDIDVAYNWYEDRLPGLGERFVYELSLAYNKIKQNPLLYGRIDKYFRKLNLDEFPFMLVYEVFDAEVYVYAVFHTKRNPKILTKRRNTI